MSRIMKSRLGDWAVALISAAFAVVLGVLIHQVDVMRQQLTAVTAALEDEQSNVEDLGGEPVAPDAEDLLANPEYAPVPGPQGEQGEQGPGPTASQVYAAVAAYFTAHPVRDGEDASPAAIAAAVANYLTEHPPAQGDPGPPPSGDQVAAAVEAYLIEHPPPAGPPGADGEDATPEAIAAEVAAYLETHPLEYCPDGYSLVAHTVLTTDGPTDQIDCVADAPEEN
jgi:hypothetical protein